MCSPNTYGHALVRIQVVINFLPVGHTHEDIDQLFSKVADELCHNGSECLPGK